MYLHHSVNHCHFNSAATCLKVCQNLWVFKWLQELSRILNLFCKREKDLNPSNVKCLISNLGILLEVVHLRFVVTVGLFSSSHSIILLHWNVGQKTVLLVMLGEIINRTLLIQSICSRMGTCLHFITIWKLKSFPDYYFCTKSRLGVYFSKLLYPLFPVFFPLWILESRMSFISSCT